METRGFVWMALTALCGCGDATSQTTGDAAATDLVATDVVVTDAAADAPRVDDVADAPPADVPPDAPFTAPPRTWTWVPVDGMRCDDGTPTGVGVNLVDGAEGTLIALNGGGVCWDASTCLVLNTSVHGPYGSAEFAATRERLPDTILDRGLANSPFARWNIVLVPYCTGDAHAGTRAADYTQGGVTRTLLHVGRSNLQRALPRIAATTPAGARVAVVGLSVGGMGAALSHDLVRAHFPAGALAVISDSGPLLQGDGVPAATRAAWYARWGLDWLDADCPDCRADLSRVYVGLAARHPDDRTAIISSRRDLTVSGYFSLAPTDFEAALRALATTFTPLPRRALFLVDGSTHTTLGRPTMVTAADGAPLLPWVTQLVTDAPAWASHGF